MEIYWLVMELAAANDLQEVHQDMFLKLKAGQMI